jgi:hypothetical protein
MKVSIAAKGIELEEGTRLLIERMAWFALGMHVGAVLHVSVNLSGSKGGGDPLHCHVKASLSQGLPVETHGLGDNPASIADRTLDMAARAVNRRLDLMRMGAA